MKYTRLFFSNCGHVAIVPAAPWLNASNSDARACCPVCHFSANPQKVQTNSVSPAESVYSVFESGGMDSVANIKAPLPGNVDGYWQCPECKGWNPPDISDCRVWEKGGVVCKGTRPDDMPTEPIPADSAWQGSPHPTYKPAAKPSAEVRFPAKMIPATTYTLEIGAERFDGLKLESQWEGLECYRDAARRTVIIAEVGSPIEKLLMGEEGKPYEVAILMASPDIAMAAAKHRKETKDASKDKSAR